MIGYSQHIYKYRNKIEEAMRQPMYFLILCTVVLGTIFLILKNVCSPFQASLIASVIVVLLMFVVIQVNKGIEHFAGILDTNSIDYMTQYDNFQIDGQIYNPDPQHYPLLTNMMFKEFKLNGNTNGKIYSIR